MERPAPAGTLPISPRVNITTIDLRSKGLHCSIPQGTQKSFRNKHPWALWNFIIEAGASPDIDRSNPIAFQDQTMRSFAWGLGSGLTVAVGMLVAWPQAGATLAALQGRIQTHVQEQWSAWRSAPGGRAAEPRAALVPITPARVAVEAARSADVPITLSGIGTVQAYNTANVRSRIDGEITRILFREGQDVKAGDPLAIIDPRPLQAQLDQQDAARLRDQALLDGALLDLQRYEALVLKDFASQQQVDRQRALVAQYRAQIKSDEAQVAYARTQLAYTTIAAPFAGRTGMRLVDQGNYVRAGDAAAIVVVTQPFLPPLRGALVLVAVLLLLAVAAWRSATNLHGHVAAGSEVLLSALRSRLPPEQGTAEMHGTHTTEFEADRFQTATHLLPGIGTPQRFVWADVRDPVPGQVERLQNRQVLQRLQVANLVLGGLQFGQSLALLQPAEVLDALAVDEQHRQLRQVVVLEVRLRKPQGGLNRLLELLIFERAGGVGRCGPEQEGEDENQARQARHERDLSQVGRRCFLVG